MIGNDIVDLRLAAHSVDWSRPRWREKVFSEKENALLDDSPSPFQLAWRMWTMKESAYKAHFRRCRERELSWKKFRCDITSEHLGQVQFDDFLYQTNTRQSEEHCMSTASDSHDTYVQSFLFDIDGVSRKTQTASLLISSNGILNKCYACAEGGVHIEKDSDAIPHAYLRGKQLPILISLSHDGVYGVLSWINQ